MPKLAHCALSLIVVTVVAATCGDTPTEPLTQSGYEFVRSLIAPSGLVRSLQGEDFTTVYKNSLAAMVFLKQGNTNDARRIFDVFKRYHDEQGAQFRGFPKDWYPDRGLPHPQRDKSNADYYWVGDNALLRVALEYYRTTNGTFGEYEGVARTLTTWLSERSDDCEAIVAEGVANMYAALAPSRTDPLIQQSLSNLRNCFIESVRYDEVLDHTVRGALVFGDPSGFAHVDRFRRTERWCRDDRPSVTAFAAFASQSYINVEISAQLLLAFRLWRPPGVDLGTLDNELQKLWVRGETAAGLPYLVTPQEFPRDCSDGILDSTAFWLFAEWGFNPFAPGKNAAG